VTSFLSSGSKIRKGWANRARLARESAWAKAGGRGREARGVPTIGEGPRIVAHGGGREGNRGCDNADHKRKINVVPAAKAADPVAAKEAGLEIRSFWRSTRTVTASCRPVKSPMQPRRSKRWTPTGMATSRVTKCAPLMLTAIGGLAGPNVRLRASRVLRKETLALP